MMKTWIATAVVVLATAACTQHIAGPPSTTVAPTNTDTAAPPWLTPAWPTSAPPSLPPAGPPSALADLNLPDGSTLVVSPSPTTVGDPSAPWGPSKWEQRDEIWHHTVPYETAVSVMSAQLGSAVHRNGVWINRCGRPLVTSGLHSWLYVGNLESINVIVERPGSRSSTGGPTPDGARITISYQLPATSKDMGGCTSG
jgi:hypothetical protein